MATQGYLSAALSWIFLRNPRREKKMASKDVLSSEWFAAYVVEGTCVVCRSTGGCVLFYETEVISPSLSIAMRSFCQVCAPAEAKEQLKLYGHFEIARPKTKRATSRKRKARVAE